MNTSLLLASPRQQAFGLRYGVFACVFLPRVLYALLGLSGLRSSAIAVNTACFCINFAVMAWVFRDFLKQSLGLFGNNWKKTVPLCAGLLTAYWLITWLMGLALSRFFPEFANSNDNSIAAMAQSSFLLTFVGTVLLVPLAEECMFRAGVFGLLYRRNPLLAYGISAALFALVHIDGFFGLADGRLLLLNFLQYLPAGVVLAAAYQLCGTVFAPVFIHMAVNALGMLTLLLTETVL